MKEVWEGRVGEGKDECQGRVGGCRRGSVVGEDALTLWSEKVRRGNETDGGKGKGGEYMNGEFEGYL